MRRREFIFGFCSAGAASALPLTAGAQSVKRIGWITPGTENDRELEAIDAEFPRELAKLGWTIGRNLQIETRRAGGNDERLRAYASDLVGKSPDVIIVTGTQTTAILKNLTGTIPIVFVNVADP